MSELENGAKRPLDIADAGRYTAEASVKKVKLDNDENVVAEPASASASAHFVPTVARDAGTVDSRGPERIRPPNETLPIPVSRLGLKPKLPDLPPSLELVTGILADGSLRNSFVGEKDVGIIGFAGPKHNRGVKGIIKQR